MKNVTHEDNSQEIQNICSLIVHHNSKITLFTDKEEKIELLIEEVIGDEYLRVKIKNKSDENKLERNKLYNMTFALEGASYTFVSHYTESVDLFKMPTLITIIDKRAYLRFSTAKLPSPYIRIKVHQKNHTFVLCDLSQGGLGFLAPRKFAKTITPNLQIKILEIGLKKFKKPIKAEIVHHSILNYDLKVFHKVGVKYQEIPEFD